MRVLGVSYGYHDSSACLVVDGAVVAASAEERFTRQKHDPNFPAYAIEHCLERAGLSPKDLDQVVFHEDPHAKFSRVLCTALAPFPTSRKEFVNSVKAWLGRKLWSLSTLSSRLDVPPEKIGYLSHHFSHAVQAFMGSGFDESAVLVLDAVGDWASSALFRGTWKDGKPSVERIVEIAYPNSLGLVYSAVTAWLGFSPNDSECSTMALAAFGTPKYADKVRRMIAALDDGTYEVDQSYFNFSNFYRGPVTDRFVADFGRPRSFKEKLPFACFGEPAEISADAQRWADVAASVQHVLEERILELCARLHKEVPSKNLCLAGGVSLNCVANGRLLRQSPFENFYIPPDPGDGGTAVGIALYACALAGGCAPEKMRYSPYVGASYDVTPDVQMIDYIKPEHISRYMKKGLEQAAPKKWQYRRFEGRKGLSQDVAARLMEGKIVGWYQGAAELGPRALGNRSILIRPDDPKLATRLSKLVKDRASYRPYAFSIAERDAERALAIDPRHIRHNRWMQYAIPVKPDVAPKVACALHVDGTTRVQVCSPADNAPYHDLLTAFGEPYGIAALLNTSFNPAGYPIVSTPAEAMVMFARTDMDVLVLDDTVVWKQ